MVTPQGKRPGSGFWLLMVVMGFLTLAATLVEPMIAVVPLVLVGLAALLWNLPLRMPTLTLLFLGMVLDNPADIGPWESPLFPLGELLLVQLKKRIPIDALVVTGMDACLALLLGLYLVRRMRGIPVDSHPVVRAPRALIIACLVGIGAVLFAWMFGLATGGEFKWSLWQLMQMLHMPWVTLAFAILLPGPRIASTVGKLIVTAALIKAVMAIIIAKQFDSDYATSHQDSILFASGSAYLAIYLLESPTKKLLAINAMLQPILMLGMIANDRRLVWVQIALSLGIIFLVSDWSWVKFRLLRLGISAIPIGLMYIAVGWNTSGTGIFKPVGTLRSMADSKSDGSTLWRDLENFNLNSTLASNPLTGTGLGHPFNEVIKLPDVTSQYALEPYVPHNSMLGLWAYTGYVGFSAWWMLLVVGSYYAFRGYRAVRDPPLRVAALFAPATQLIYMMHAYGDIGLGAWHGVLIVGSTAVAASKIAVDAGACDERPRARPPERAAPLPSNGDVGKAAE